MVLKYITDNKSKVMGMAACILICKAYLTRETILVNTEKRISNMFQEMNHTFILLHQSKLSYCKRKLAREHAESNKMIKRVLQLALEFCSITDELLLCQNIISL